MNHAAGYLTYPATIVTFALTGLHVTDVCVILSTIAAISGAGAQVLGYLRSKKNNETRSP